MRSRPPGSKSATVEETEDWDDVVFGTSDLAENYGKYDCTTRCYIRFRLRLHIQFPPGVKCLFTLFVES